MCASTRPVATVARLLAMTTALLASTAQARHVPPYLSEVSDTSVKLKLATTAGAGAITVEWGVASVSENTVTAATCDAHPGCALLTDDFESDVDPFYVFHLTGLSAGTLYQYRVTGTSVTTPVRTFSTAPAHGATTPFTFVAFGDNRSSLYDHRRVVGRVYSNPPDFIVNTGDHVEFDVLFGEDFFGQWYSWFDIESSVTANPDVGYPLLQLAPTFNARGNHDDDSDFFLDVFRKDPETPNPTSADGYFSFDYGNAHFLCLDSNDVSAAQIAFIDADLAAASADPAIGPMFAFFHHGAHSNGVHGGSTRTLNPDVAGAFQFYGVDIVFQGHDHLYTRYQPINGVTYVVTGGGGAPLYPANHQNQSPIAYTRSIQHHTEITVSGNTIALTAIDVNGNVIDSYAIANAEANGGVPKDYNLGLPGDGVGGCAIAPRSAEDARASLAGVFLGLAAVLLPRRVRVARRRA